MADSGAETRRFSTHLNVDVSQDMEIAEEIDAEDWSRSSPGPDVINQNNNSGSSSHAHQSRDDQSDHSFSRIATADRV
ncbi:hypothetical protein QQF64_019782 [Cirrhinus molitorella]|uniref:Uncharacterized protein n=1 Tax=Cirrhinus molitorella TaxID=172907 RepID=A0ABR3LIT5_9TELE